jgi:hypothetical protein
MTDIFASFVSVAHACERAAYRGIEASDCRTWHRIVLIEMLRRRNHPQEGLLGFELRQLV